MKGKEERGRRGGERERGGTALGGNGQGGREEATRHEVDEDGAGGVQEEVGEVIADRVHAPEEVIEAEGDPGQGHVVADVKGGEHPLELGPAEAAVGRVVEEVLAVVPAAHEVVAKGLLEGGEGGKGDDGRDQPESPPRRGRGA